MKLKAENIKVLFDRVLVRLHEDAEATDAGILLPDTATKEGLQTGQVIAAGLGKVVEGVVVPMQVQVGDNVGFFRHAAQELEIPDDRIVVLREYDCVFVDTTTPTAPEPTGVTFDALEGGANGGGQD